MAYVTQTINIVLNPQNINFFFMYDSSFAMTKCSCKLWCYKKDILLHNINSQVIFFTFLVAFRVREGLKTSIKFLYNCVSLTYSNRTTLFKRIQTYQIELHRDVWNKTYEISSKHSQTQ